MGTNALESLSAEGRLRELETLFLGGPLSSGTHDSFRSHTHTHKYPRFRNGMQFNVIGIGIGIGIGIFY